MRKNDRIQGISMIGSSSLLVIFAVLCLTVFALLTLSTALAGDRLSRKAAQAVENHYAAELAAEQILASLRSGELPEGVSEQNGIFTYTCPISDVQTLAVAVRMEEDDYTLLCWQAVPTAEWEADPHIEVWNGDFEED